MLFSYNFSNFPSSLKSLYISLVELIFWIWTFSENPIENLRKDWTIKDDNLWSKSFIKNIPWNTSSNLQGDVNFKHMSVFFMFSLILNWKFFKIEYDFNVTISSSMILELHLQHFMQIVFFPVGITLLFKRLTQNGIILWQQQVYSSTSEFLSNAYSSMISF